LHSVFCILALPADPHAERKDSVLKQCQRLFHRSIISTLQQFYRFFDLRTHGFNLTRKSQPLASTSDAKIRGLEKRGWIVSSPQVFRASSEGHGQAQVLGMS
jgi:hypothetical protein